MVSALCLSTSLQRYKFPIICASREVRNPPPPPPPPPPHQGEGESLRVFLCPPPTPLPRKRGRGEYHRRVSVTPHDHGSAGAEPTVVGGYASFLLALLPA